LRHQRGLYAVEQPLQPAHQLCLRDAQLRLARRVVGERQRQAFQLVTQLRGQPVLQFGDRAPVDLPEPLPARLVQRSGPYLLQQLFDHAADPHDLRRLLDQLRRIVRLVLRRLLGDVDGTDGPAVRSHDEDGPRVIRLRLLLRGVIRHGSILPYPIR